VLQINLIKKTCCFSCVVFLFAQTVSAQKDYPFSGYIDSVANEALNAGPVAGLSIAIMQHDKLVFAKGYGFANLEHSIPATAETVYGMRSVSKNFTAVAILLLVQDGKISLDDNINKYLPDFSTKGQVITIRQLLNHTSGIPNYGGKRFHENKARNLSAAEWVALYKDDSLNFEPGTSYHYSNTGYLLLEMIMDKVTGSFADFVRKRITDSLGLYFATPYSQIIKNSSGEYEVNKGVFTKAMNEISKISGPNGMRGNVVNVIKYQQSLNKGRIINSNSITEMHKPGELKKGLTVDYGLGTRIGEIAGYNFFGHTGSGGGGTSILTYYPETGLIMVVATNTEVYHRDASYIQNVIAKKILDIKESEISTNSFDTTKILGFYKLQDLRLKIFKKDGKLMGEPEGSNQPAHLVYQGEGRFSIKEVPRQVVKFEDINGTIWIQLYWDGFFQGIGQKE
jgi:D-alanyl-D-alanine carboxypeptidase